VISRPHSDAASWRGSMSFTKRGGGSRHIICENSQGVTWGSIEEEEGNVPAYFRFVVELLRNDAGGTIDGMEDAGVQCRRPFEEPVFRMLGESDLPGCSEAFESFLSLPVYPLLAKADVLHITKELRRHMAEMTG